MEIEELEVQVVPEGQELKEQEVEEHTHKITMSDEHDEEHSSKSRIVNEIKVTLNTGSTARAEYLTKTIQGELDSIIIVSNEIINVRISLEEYDDVVLYVRNGFMGTKYLSLVNDATYFNNERSQFSSAKWLLNDRLKIIVEGNYNNLVSFIIRWY